MSNPYSLAIKNSEKSSWILDEVLPENTVLDLTKQFIPMSPAHGANELSSFSPEEILLISRLHASGYTYLIHIVEEYIVDLVSKQFADPEKMESLRVRALSRFLDEEVKHQQLFARFNDILKKQMQTKILVQDTGHQFSKKILSHRPLSIWLLTLHTEVMTHYHYTDIFKVSAQIEPQFINVLKQHWLEESQHVKIDRLEIQGHIQKSSPEELALVVSDYFQLLKYVDHELHISAQILIENFKAISGSSLDGFREKRLRSFLIRVLRNFMIYAGVKHPTFIEAFKAMGIGAENQLMNVQNILEAQAPVLRAA